MLVASFSGFDETEPGIYKDMDNETEAIEEYVLKNHDHLRKLPMGYFTEGNIGKISSVLATDMVFIEENCMGVLSELVTFIISQGIMTAMMFVMDIRLGLLSSLIVAVFIVVGNLMLKTTMKHSVIKQEASESLTEEVLDFAEGIRKKVQAFFFLFFGEVVRAFS